jgi:hypothetical protein
VFELTYEPFRPLVQTGLSPEPRGTSMRQHWISTNSSELAGFQLQLPLHKTVESLEFRRRLAG